jgi:hypothetical protein
MEISLPHGKTGALACSGHSAYWEGSGYLVDVFGLCEVARPRGEPAADT